MKILQAWSTGYVGLIVQLHSVDAPAEAVRARVEEILRSALADEINYDSDVQVDLEESAGV